MRSLASQLLVHDTALSPYILETYASNGLRPVKKTLGAIMEKLISSLPCVRIIVDGLDECPQIDHDEAIEDLLRIRGPSPGACKVLVSSRDIPSISRKIREKATVRLDDYAENVNLTISSYVNSRLSILHRDFSADLINDLGHQIITKAKGQS